MVSIIPVVQYFLGVIFFSGDAWVVFFYLVTFSLMLLAAYNLTLESSPRDFFACLLAVLFVVGAILSLCVALYQWLQLPVTVWVVDLPYRSRPFANFAQPNNLATMLCMGVAGLMYLYEKNFLNRAIVAFLAALLVFGIALTSSRTPWVSGLVVIVFWMWKSTTVGFRLGFKDLFFWAMLYVFFVAVLPCLSEFLRPSAEGGGIRFRGLQRLDIWKQFGLAVLKGGAYGWNQISFAQVGITLAFPVPIITEHSHNVFLDILLWNGLILGGGINLFIVCGGFYLCWRARDIESVFALVASLFILTHGMLEFPLEYAFFLFPLGLLIGMAEAGHPSRLSVILPRWLLVGILGVAAGLFFRVLYEYKVVEYDVQLLRFENARIGSVKEERHSDIYFLSQLAEWIKYARSVPEANMSAAELEAMRMVAHRYPNAPSLLRYIKALYMNGRHEAVKEQMLILRGLHGIERYNEGCQILLLMQDGQFTNLKGFLPDC